MTLVLSEISSELLWLGRFVNVGPSDAVSETVLLIENEDDTLSVGGRVTEKVGLSEGVVEGDSESDNEGEYVDVGDEDGAGVTVGAGLFVTLDDGLPERDGVALKLLLCVGEVLTVSLGS